MSGRRKNNSQPTAGTVKHHQITKFVGINIEKTEKEEQNNSSAKGPIQNFNQSNNASISAKSELKENKRITNKRVRPDSTSPDTNCDNQPQKKQAINMTEPQKTKKSIDSDNSVLNPELTELKKQLFAGFEQLIEQSIEPLKKDIQELKNEQTPGERTLNVETLSLKLKQNDIKHKKLEDRLNLIEDQLLEGNLIFQGLPETEFDDNDDAKIKIIKAMTLTMQGDTEEMKKTKAAQTSIEQVERIGKYNPLRARPIKVKFSNKNDAVNVLKNKKKLPKGVFVDKEYCKATEKERRLLRPIIKAARRMESYKGLCRMDGAHIVLDGKKYHRKNLHTLPDGLSVLDVTTKSNEDTIAFFGELNPFSNFHGCNFMCDGQNFHSSEQYIQWKKAELFGDTISMDHILNSEDALESKTIARDIKDYNRQHWNDRAESLCYEGIKQKFEQNTQLKEILLATDNKILVEASYDDVWGTGIPLSNIDCLTPSKWKTQGILGRILVHIRNSYLDNSKLSENDSEETTMG